MCHLLGVLFISSTTALAVALEYELSMAIINRELHWRRSVRMRMKLLNTARARDTYAFKRC